MVYLNKKEIEFFTGLLIHIKKLLKKYDISLEDAVDYILKNSCSIVSPSERLAVSIRNRILDLVKQGVLTSTNLKSSIEMIYFEENYINSIEIFYQKKLLYKFLLKLKLNTKLIEKYFLQKKYFIKKSHFLKDLNKEIIYQKENLHRNLRKNKSNIDKKFTNPRTKFLIEYESEFLLKKDIDNLLENQSNKNIKLAWQFRAETFQIKLFKTLCINYLESKEKEIQAINFLEEKKIKLKKNIYKSLITIPYLESRLLI